MAAPPADPSSNIYEFLQFVNDIVMQDKKAVETMGTNKKHMEQEHTVYAKGRGSGKTNKSSPKGKKGFKKKDKRRADNVLVQAQTSSRPKKTKKGKPGRPPKGDKPKQSSDGNKKPQWKKRQPNVIKNKKKHRPRPTVSLGTMEQELDSADDSEPAVYIAASGPDGEIQFYEGVKCWFCGDTSGKAKHKPSECPIAPKMNYKEKWMRTRHAASKNKNPICFRCLEFTGTNHPGGEDSCKQPLCPNQTDLDRPCLKRHHPSMCWFSNQATLNRQRNTAR
jgi:hypothetical protein